MMLRMSSMHVDVGFDWSFDVKFQKMFVYFLFFQCLFLNHLVKKLYRRQKVN